MTVAPSFSRRELQIIELVGQDMTDRQICVQLGIRLPTVSVHLSNIAEKLKLRERGIRRRHGIRQWIKWRSGKIGDSAE